MGDVHGLYCCRCGAMVGAVYKVVAGEREAEKNDERDGWGGIVVETARHPHSAFLPPGKLLAQAP